VQTRKAPNVPIVCFDRAYWTRIVNFQALLEEGMITTGDLDLFSFADDAEEAWKCLLDRGLSTAVPDD
jgi:predicted Rossmann-fold nucleotide-binding protein